MQETIQTIMWYINCIFIYVVSIEIVVQLMLLDATQTKLEQKCKFNMLYVRFFV